MAVGQELWPSRGRGDPSYRVAFLDAARRCDGPKLSRLLRGNKGAVTPDVNVRLGAGRTPLFQAASAGSPLCVKILLKAGADVNLRDFTGRTALMHAVERNNSDCVELLLEAGPDVDVRDKKGNTALMKAASAGGSEITRMLIQAGARVKRYNRVGNTALTFAAIYGHADCARVLLESGGSSSADQRNETRNSVESETAGEVNSQTKGNDVAVETEPGGVKTPGLSESGAAPWLLKLKNKDGVTPLIAAINQNNLIGKEKRFVYATVKKCKLDCVKVLLDHGAAVNTPNKNVGYGFHGYTPLYHATVSDNQACVDMLLRAGADVSASEDTRDSPLLAAITNHNKDIMVLLLEAGANVNHGNYWHHTALSAATENGESDVVKLLLKYGAITVNGSTRRCFDYLDPLQIAINPNGTSESLALLFAGGSFNRTRDGHKSEQNWEKTSLKTQCRREIRERLLVCASYERNLFVTVQELPLPYLLQSYLLYYVTLDDQETQATQKVFKFMATYDQL